MFHGDSTLKHRRCSLVQVQKVRPSHLVLGPGPGRPEPRKPNVRAGGTGGTEVFWWVPVGQKDGMMWEDVTIYDAVMAIYEL